MAQASFEPGNSRSRALRSAVAPHWLGGIQASGIKDIKTRIKHGVFLYRVKDYSCFLTPERVLLFGSHCMYGAYQQSERGRLHMLPLSGWLPTLSAAYATTV